MVGGGEGGADAKATAVEVDKYGEFCGGGEWWEVDAGGDAGGG